MVWNLLVPGFITCWNYPLELAFYMINFNIEYTSFLQIFPNEFHWHSNSIKINDQFIITGSIK